MVPVLVAIGSTLLNVIAILREFRKTASFVIAAVVWGLFVWLLAWFSTRADTVLNELGTAQDGGSVSSISSLVSFFDKIEYMFPIYTAFSCLGLYCSVRFSVFVVKWLFRAWDAVPFKGSAAS